MNQTIAAIATGPVSGPIGIVRISGPDTMAVIDRVFHPQDGKPLSHSAARLGRLPTVPQRLRLLLPQKSRSLIEKIIISW